MRANLGSGALAARDSFAARDVVRLALIQVRRRLHRIRAERCRLQSRLARDDRRAWVVKRWERTRQLIGLGGLVAKAGIIELADDDRAAIYGALLNIAAMLRSERRDQALLLWRRNGKRAFASDQKGD